MRFLTAVATAAVVAVLAMLVVVTRPAEADALDRMTVDDLGLARAVTAERAWNGVDWGDPHAMVLDGDLTAQAQKQAERMVECGCTEHSPAGERGWFLGRGWTGIAENVAGGFPSVYAAHVGLMRSRGHQANILDPAWRGYGVAARWGADGRVYVVEVFGTF